MVRETGEWIYDLSCLSVDIDGNLLFCVNIPYVKVEVLCHTVLIYDGKFCSVHLVISRNIVMVLFEEGGSYKVLEQWDENYNKSLGCVEYHGRLARGRVHNFTFPSIMLVWLNDYGM